MRSRLPPPCWHTAHSRPAGVRPRPRRFAIRFGPNRLQLFFLVVHACTIVALVKPGIQPNLHCWLILAPGRRAHGLAHGAPVDDPHATDQPRTIFGRNELEPTKCHSRKYSLTSTQFLGLNTPNAFTAHPR